MEDFFCTVKNEAGSAEVTSLIGILPFVLVILLAVLQISMLGYVLVVTESAARDGARAEAARHSGIEAVARVESSSGVILKPTVECPSGEGYVRVTVDAKIPTLFFVPANMRDLFSLSRSVVMPKEGNCP